MKWNVYPILPKAAPDSPDPWGAAIPQDRMNPIETVALCFYPNGWAGPGYY
jgi:hypothetical protein